MSTGKSEANERGPPLISTGPIGGPGRRNSQCPHLISDGGYSCKNGYTAVNIRSGRLHNWALKLYGPNKVKEDLTVTPVSRGE